MTTETTTFRRHVSPGLTDRGRLFLTIEYRESAKGPELSITGVEGPKQNGDCAGSCGQCIDALSRIERYADGWTPELAARTVELWERWHLNGMRPGCEHQRDWPTTEKVELVSYGLTTRAYQRRNDACARAAKAAALGQEAILTPEERALVLLDDWFRDRHSPPDADSPLSECYEVKKREQKALGWLRQDEHPRGLLSRPCPTCGYKYGSAWLYEPVPVAVLDELLALPNEATPPGGWAR